MNLPNQYEAVYGKDGLMLSTEQKQRIALSRVFLRNPDLIILDEPTANLDPKSSESIMEALLDFSKDKLLIIVTHDRYMLEKFDYRYSP
ncbi:ABC-type bacteriocin/lantibiotic exporter with double-glycine peptidase domain [Gracilibacillus alcaliphilus]|nr:ABC-type bacteriocin/lantibiotic exporter with double-glycine peptidase domain [Gracilibacillus alcaliphilus]